MKSVLIIGGYGGFGARLARRLSDGDTMVLVAGRNLAKADAFAATLPNARGTVADREQPLDALLASAKPDLVIDAAGPFQGSSYAVPRACIAAGVPYVDLADAREFVVDFLALEADAVAAGVALVTGASSVPALSGAAVRALMQGLDRAERIDMAITASNKASAGESVARAILSYAGRPLSLWRGQRWARQAGWSDLARIRFDVPGAEALHGRWVALADIPDHALLPNRVAGQPAVTFRAGTELGFQMVGLWLASFLVRVGMMKSLLPFAPIVLPFIHVTRNWGGDRSAMQVIVTGWRRNDPVEMRWTLIAEHGDGPEIPTLAAELIARKLLAGTIAPGASDAGPLLNLSEFTPLFDRLHLAHAMSETPLPAPLYARAMGSGFAALPPAVRDMHNLVGDGGAAGEGTVERPRNPLARLIGAIMRFPPAGHYPLHVDFAVDQGKERWIRNFGGHSFTSELSQDGNGVTERFGPMRFGFALPSDDKGLGMVLQRWSIFGIPLPRALAPSTDAREWQDDQDRFRFDVDVSLPVIGRVVHYSGWLRRLGRA